MDWKLRVGADPRVSTILPVGSGLLTEGVPKEEAQPKMKMAMPAIGKDYRIMFCEPFERGEEA